MATQAQGNGLYPERILSYVVASDNGLAPNITGGICTLAVCKPVVRQMAQKGDWVVGFSTAKHGEMRVIYAMEVAEKIGYADYWRDPRFAAKKPGAQNPYGDNFFENKRGILQCRRNARHFGNNEKIARDLKSPVVLIGENFRYFGGNAPETPNDLGSAIENIRYMTLAKPHLHAGRRGHRVTTDTGLIHDFVDWIGSWTPGIHGTPRDLKI